jgi:hypothetical protein
VAQVTQTPVLTVATHQFLLLLLQLVAAAAVDMLTLPLVLVGTVVQAAVVG